eukprot:gb/GEZN01004471.1/.p1 GENE.gb/GEZN01004471.1/~~gb/GEZN01004471.1/.p1  ORF type:complete len:628 (+),score=53.68 gb/GEZN01004471.1/:63-1886(+)
MFLDGGEDGKQAAQLWQAGRLELAKVLGQGDLTQMRRGVEIVRQVLAQGTDGPNWHYFLGHTLGNLVTYSKEAVNEFGRCNQLANAGMMFDSKAVEKSCGLLGMTERQFVVNWMASEAEEPGTRRSASHRTVDLPVPPLPLPLLEAVGAEVLLSEWWLRGDSEQLSAKPDLRQGRHRKRPLKSETSKAELEGLGPVGQRLLVPVSASEVATSHRFGAVQLRKVTFEGPGYILYSDCVVFGGLNKHNVGLTTIPTLGRPGLPRRLISCPMLYSVHQYSVSYYHFMVTAMSHLLLTYHWLRPRLSRNSNEGLLHLISPVPSSVSGCPLLPQIIVGMPGTRFAKQALQLLGSTLPEGSGVFVSFPIFPDGSEAYRPRWTVEELWAVDSDPDPPRPYYIREPWYPPAASLQLLRLSMHRAVTTALIERPAGLAVWPKVLYASRRSSQDINGSTTETQARQASGRPRTVPNVSALLVALREAVGAENVFELVGSDLSVGQQVELSRHARVLLGPHGAGLTNALWLTPGSALIEFGLTPRIQAFQHLAANLDLRYFRVEQLSTSLHRPYPALSGAQIDELAGLVTEIAHTQGWLVHSRPQPSSKTLSPAKNEL